METTMIREQLMASGIEHLSFSSMKELRNNEAMFLKKYINYEFDNNVFVATIIGKSCHYAIEMLYRDEEHIKNFDGPDQATWIEKITKIGKDYAKEEYIAKYKKSESFWNAPTMIAFGGYIDLVKLVDDIKKINEEINNITTVERSIELEAEKATIMEKINEAIAKHREKDEKLDDFIQWGVKGSYESIMEGIEIGMRNWFTIVYPKVKAWKLIGSELSKTVDIADLNGEILALPVKIIIDAVFEDENGDIIIVDWKFKGQLSDDESIKPDYDMQGTTYYFGGWSVLGKKPKKAIFIEIQPAEAKCTVVLQADLRKICDENKIDWATGNKGKYMTNAMMQEVLLKIGAIETKPVVYEYVIDFEAQPYLIAMWLVFYEQTISRLYRLLVEGDEFIINIFDQSFNGGISVYTEWMKEFQKEE